MTTTTQEQLEGLGTYKFGWADSDVAGASERRGLSEEVVRDISARKNESEWMLDMRLRGLKLFGRKPLPDWGADLSEIDFDNIKYFVRSTEKQAASWDELPADIKNTYDRLGIPEAEKQRLIAGVAAQYAPELIYPTIQNGSANVYKLVTKRAVAQAGATMEWIDGNIGSKVTMKYPAVYLMGEHAKGETLSVAFAGEGQHQDAGAKMVHLAPNTSSTIVSKSVARAGGRTSYRGLVNVQEGAEHSKSNVKCDALLVDSVSRSDTYPYVDVREDDVEMAHEATVSKISEDQLFYLMSRGMTEDEAMATIVRGFVEPIARELPMEHALELNRLIELQMEGAVG